MTTQLVCVLNSALPIMLITCVSVYICDAMGSRQDDPLWLWVKFVLFLFHVYRSWKLVSWIVYIAEASVECYDIMVKIRRLWSLLIKCQMALLVFSLLYPAFENSSWTKCITLFRKGLFSMSWKWLILYCTAPPQYWRTCRRQTTKRLLKMSSMILWRRRPLPRKPLSSSLCRWHQSDIIGVIFWDSTKLLREQQASQTSSHSCFHRNCGHVWCSPLILIDKFLVIIYLSSYRRKVRWSFFLSGASQHNSSAISLLIPWDPKLIRKDVIYTPFKSKSSLERLS